MAQIKLRRDTYQHWYDANPVLASGEPAYDTTNNKIKVGDGTTNWRGLSYLTDATGGSNYSNSNVESYLATSNVTIGDDSSGGAYFITKTSNSISLGSVAAQVITLDNNGIAIGGTGGVTIQGALGANVDIGGQTSGNVNFPNGITFSDGSHQTTAAHSSNQSLNTTSDVTFNSVTTANIFQTNGDITLTTNPTLNGNVAWTFGANGQLTVPSANGIDIKWNTDTAGAGAGGGGGDASHYASARIHNDHVTGLYITNATDATESSWLFSKNGNLVFPDGSIQQTAYTGSNPFNQSLNTTDNVTFSNVTVNGTLFGNPTIGPMQQIVNNKILLQPAANINKPTTLWTSTNGSTGGLQFPEAGGSNAFTLYFPHENGDAGEIFIEDGGFGMMGLGTKINISTIDSNATQYTWAFGIDGNLTFPDGTIQSTAYTGSSSYTDANVTTLLSAFGSNNIVTTGNLSVGNIHANAHGNLVFGAASATGNPGMSSTTTLSIVTNSGASNTEKQWIFNNDGALDAPSDIRTPGNVLAQKLYFINTDGMINANGNVYINSNIDGMSPMWSFLENGNLQLPLNNVAIQFGNGDPISTSTATANRLVLRDSAGDFSANNISVSTLETSGAANIGGNVVVWGNNSGNVTIKMIGTGIISSTDDSNTIIRTKTSTVAPGGERTYDFTFGVDGKLITPGDVSIPQGSSFKTSGLGILTGIRGQTSDVYDTMVLNDHRMYIYTNWANVGSGGQKVWAFGDNGVLTFPDGSTQSTAYTGASSYGDSNVTTLLSSFGSNTITTTGDISVGNITATNIGNISSINKDGNASNILLGNGVFSSSSLLKTLTVPDTTFAVTQGSSHSMTSAMYRVVFTGAGSSTSSTVVLPDTNTCYIGQSFVLVSPTQNYNYTIQLHGGISSGKTWTAGMTVVATVVAQRGGSAEVAGNWSYSWQGAYSVTGSGPTVLSNAPIISAPVFTGNVDLAQSGAFLGQTGEKYSTWGYAVNNTTTAVPTAVATGGVFTIPNTQGLGSGQTVTITGTNSGTGSISGYTSGTTYYIIGNTLAGGVTTITLATARNSATGVTVTAGTLTGLTMTFGAQVSVNLYGSATNNGAIVNVTGTIGSNFDLSILGQINTSYAMSVTIIINQGATPYMLGNVYLGSINNYAPGTAQTISWQGGSAPTGTANKKDVITLSWLPNSTTTAAVILGQMVSFG